MTCAAVIPFSDFGTILHFCFQVLGASLFFITAHAAFYNYDALEGIPHTINICAPRVSSGSTGIGGFQSNPTVKNSSTLFCIKV